MHIQQFSLSSLILSLALASGVQVSLYSAQSIQVEGTSFGGQPVLMVRAPAVDDLPIREAAKLRQLVTVDWADVTVAEACDVLARLTQAVIVVDPELRADNQKRLTLAVQDMRADRVLEWVRTLSGTTVRVMHGGMYVTNRHQGSTQNTVLRVYPVGDLVQPLAHFPGPDLQLGAVGGGALPVDAVDQNVQFMGVEELAEIVEELLVHR